jgi:hypothetical protein
VRSRNFRVELGAAAGLSYPTGARPIALFVAIEPRSFLYMLVMPASPHYSTVADILERWSRSPRNQVKRVTLSVEDLRSEWPASPFWSFT